MEDAQNKEKQIYNEEQEPIMERVNETFDKFTVEVKNMLKENAQGPTGVDNE